MVILTDDTGEYDDWIEIYNAGSIMPGRLNYDSKNLTMVNYFISLFFNPYK